MRKETNMTNIPIAADVQCTDGPCGKSTSVIYNPVNHKLTHFALQDKNLPENPTRLVPADKITGATPKQIALNCSVADVQKMPAFVVTDFVQESPSGYAYASGEAYHSEYVINDTAYDSFDDEVVPSGEVSIHSGMLVEASDGKVGRLDELVLDGQSGEVTHLLMREGHLWGKKDVAIAISDVDFADGDTVYLKINKDSIKSLPAVKVKRS
jgi:hypothetical protein